MTSLDDILNRLICKAQSDDRRTDELTADDIEFLRNDISNKLCCGWNSDDIFRFLSLTEEVNPFIAEDAALAIMNKISAKYDNYDLFK